MDQDPKQLAVYLARGRAVLGLVMTAAPGVVGRLLLGRGGATGPARALTRMMGIRDVALGVGAVTSLNETDHGPEWISMGAAADAVDALALTFGRGVTKRARLVGLVAAGAAAANLLLARQLADRREAEAPTILAEVAPEAPTPGSPVPVGVDADAHQADADALEADANTQADSGS